MQSILVTTALVFRFWSQILYSSRSLDGLVSFLQEALPYYVLPEFLTTPRLEEAYHKTAELVFQAFIRLSVFDSKVRNSSASMIKHISPLYVYHKTHSIPHFINLE